MIGLAVLIIGAGGAVPLLAVIADPAPAAVKALLIGSHDPRGQVLRANNLTRPGVSWGGDGPAFVYEQTYAELGSYRLPVTQGICVTQAHAQFCEGNQILGGAAWPLPLLPNRRYLFAATVRAEFPRTLTEVDVHMILYDDDKQLLNYYSRMVGMPWNTSAAPAAADGWTRWEWEFVTPPQVATGRPVFVEYVANNTMPPQLEIVELVLIETPAAALRPLPGLTGAAFRGSVGSLPMSIDECTSQSITTTAARYVFLADGTIEAMQRIDMPRRVATWNLSVPLTGLHVLSSVGGPSGRCVIGNSAVTIAVQPDGVMVLVPQTEAHATLTNQFGGTFNRLSAGHLLSEDDWGGITVSPHIPLGSGRFARSTVLTQGLSFVGLGPDDTDSNATTEAAGWKVRWDLSPGERLFTSVMPVRPFDWAVRHA